MGLGFIRANGPLVNAPRVRNLQHLSRWGHQHAELADLLLRACSILGALVLSRCAFWLHGALSLNLCQATRNH